MPMIASGTPKERENEQQDADQSQSSCAAGPSWSAASSSSGQRWACKSRECARRFGSLPPSRHVRFARRADVRPMPAFMPDAQKAVDYSFGVLESRTAQTLLSPTAPVRGFNARRSAGLNEQEERRMAKAAEFLARW